MKILILFLCFLVPSYLYSANPEKLPPFTFTFNNLAKQVVPPAKKWIRFTLPKQSPLVAKLRHTYHLYKPKALTPNQIFRGEADTNIHEASSIRGVAPKFLYRDLRSIKGRFQGRMYISPRHYYYVGGYRSLWWRDPSEMGIFAGSGIDF